MRKVVGMAVLGLQRGARACRWMLFGLIWGVSIAGRRKLLGRRMFVEEI